MFFRKVPLTCLPLLFCAVALAQHPYVAADKLLKNREYEKCLALLRQIHRNDSSGALLERLATVSIRLRNFDEAEQFLDRAEKTFQQRNVPIPPNLHFTRGQLYYHWTQFDKSFRSFSRAQQGYLAQRDSLNEAIAQHWIGNVFAHGFYKFSFGLDHYKQAMVYLKRLENTEQLAALQYDMARVYQNLNEFETSLLYLDDAQNFYESNTRFREELADCHNLRGIHLSFAGYSDSSLAYFDQAIKITKSLPKQRAYSLGKYYDNMGVIHRLTSDTSGNNSTQAKYYLLKGLNENKAYRFNSRKVVDSYLNLSEHYSFRLSDYRMAEQYVQEAIRVTRETYPEKNSRMAVMYMHLADLKIPLRQIDSALYYYQKALISEIDDFNDERLSANPQSYGSGYSFNLPYSLSGKAKAFFARYQARGDLGDLRLAFATLMRADSLIQLYNRAMDWEESKTYFSANVRPIYETALRYAHELYMKTGNASYTEAAFRLMEDSRQLILLDNVGYASSNNNLRVGGLRRELNRLRFIAEQGLASERAEIESEIRRYKRMLQSYYDSMSHFGANFTKVRSFADSKVAAEAMKASIVEFFHGDSSTFVLIIPPVGHAWIREVPAGRLSNIQRYFELISNAPESAKFTKDFDDFTGLSREIYTGLFDGVTIEGENLLIIPDGELVLIPFETLLQDDKDAKCQSYECLPYLVRSKRVSYAFSVSVLLESAGRESEMKTALSVIPQTLFASGLRETRILNQYFEVRNISQGDSTKEHFLMAAENYDIIHITSHGLSNDTNGLNGYLDLSSDGTSKLFAYEMYGRRLKASLVMLTSCETGAGEVKEGEGLVSLARSFIMAGSRSVVSSLWKLPDFSSVELVSNFYSNFVETHDAGAALAASKIRYIESHDEISAHPYYWAALTLSGATRSAPAPAFNRIAVIAAIGGVVLVLGGLLIRHYKKQRSFPDPTIPESSTVQP